MSEAGKGWRERMVMLVGAAVSLVLGWLTWRYMEGMAALAWVFWVVGAASALFALLAPIAWIRMVLGWSIFTQDMFRR